jgi:succinoglycan biosynthesis transport protein ExoP
VQGVSTISASELSLTGERMIDARRQRAEAESQYRQVQKMGAGGWEKLASVPAVLADPVVQKFKAEQAKAQAKVDELSSRYGARHPAMEAARSDLTAASASLRAQVEQVVAGIERAYQLAVANEGSLQSSFDANKSQIQDISRKEFKLRELQREVDGNRALYDTFMTRLRETTATSDLDTAYIRVVDQAVAPTAPIKPKKSLLVALAALVGLLIGCVLTLVREALNSTFRSVEQIESLLNVPLLGVVPKVKANAGELAEMFDNDKHRTFGEAIRTIRTGLLMNDAQHPQKVVLVTSTVPGEGKSTVAVNLAGALGQIEKVLLIDADFRRSRLARTFGLPLTTPGLGNLLEGTAPLASCVHTINDVDVLCTGTAGARPLELLASNRFKVLLEKLGERYDRIIIDSPPLHAVSDAVMLSSNADAVIYVVRSDATSRVRVRKALQRLQHNHANICGVVLNRVDIRKASNSGYSYDGFYDYFDYSAPGSPKLLAN